MRFLLCLALLGALVACGTPVEQRPTLPPIIDFTPGPTQDVGGTATAFALRDIPSPTPPGLYVVRAGDTLESIAIAFNTTINALTMTNRISDANTIFVGQPLIIPSLLSDTAAISSELPLESVESPTPSP